MRAGHNGGMDGNPYKAPVDQENPVVQESPRNLRLAVYTALALMIASAIGTLLLYRYFQTAIDSLD